MTPKQGGSEQGSGPRTGARGRSPAPPAGGPAGPAHPAGAFAVERLRVGPLPLWAWSMVTGLAVWTIYVLTLAPSTAFWDTSEYIATAHILGIPHPPGNPLFVMVGRTWDVLLGWTGLPVAVRINLLSATASAGASVLWFLTVTRIWAHFTESPRRLLVVGIVSVLVGATAFTVWFQSNVNAKVYTLALLFVAVITYLAMLWEDVADTVRGDRLVLLVAFLLGLGATNHLMALLPVGALGAFVLWHRARTLARPRLVGLALLLGIIGYSVQFLFVPIRSRQEPVIDEADPECESLVKAAVTPLEAFPGLKAVVPEGAYCEPLRAAVAREQYAKPPLTDRQAPYWAQLANYVQYFNWQWARGLGWKGALPVTVLFTLLGAVGLWRHWEGDRDSFVYFGVLLATLVPLLVFYLNFRYGYSLFPDIPPEQHEVRERDYFYLVSFNIWGLYAGLGIVTVWDRVAGWVEDRLADGGGAGSASGSHLRASPVLAIALLPLLFNWSSADRSGDYSARDWAYNVLQSVEPYGVLFTNGDNDTFPLWYLQEVEGIRRDVTVIVHSYLGTRWYPKQLRNLTAPCPPGVDPSDRPTVVVCQRPFDPEGAIAPYRGMEASPPSRPIHALSDGEVDSLPSLERVGREMEVPFGDHVEGTLRANSVVTVADLLVYFISRNSLGDRPVYFAATAPPVYGTWNLQPHLLRQGLALKLVDGILESTADTVQLRPEFGIRWIDRDRTNHLLWDVFQVEYLLDWEVWPEPSTRASIPAQYYLAYFALGEADRLRDTSERASRSYARAEEFMDLSGIQ